ncbi:restriction endonuclease subunit S, partial [Nocardia sp. NPDC058497]|uniref:restriction endonuclease subunit S n=1 Tax=Nocardia sp. NPDC058497 TaxID=3346529 RepID=UPI0036510361
GESEPRIVMVDATALKFKASERDRPAFAGAKQIAALVREPFELVPGETRSVMIDKAVGPARMVAVPVSAVAARDYLLTPHTYLSADEVAGEPRIRRIADSARSAETALAGALVPVSAPTPFIRNDVQKSGYPEGWKVRKLVELCDIKAGPSRLKRSLMVTGDDARVPVLRPSSLKARHISGEGLDRTTEKVAWNFADYGLLADDILVVRVGQVQDAAIVGENMDGWLFDSNLTRLRVRPDVEVEPRYLLEFLLCRRTSDRIRATASVHVAPTMSAGELAELEVPVPPPAQQRVIVAALVKREERIVSLRQAIRAEEEMRDVLAEALVGGVVGLDGV